MSCGIGTVSSNSGCSFGLYYIYVLHGYLLGNVAFAAAPSQLSVVSAADCLQQVVGIASLCNNMLSVPCVYLLIRIMR